MKWKISRLDFEAFSHQNGVGYREQRTTIDMTKILQA